MTVAIGTSSLLSFVRYYLPFDSKGFLFEFLKKKIKKGEIVVIDEVYNESYYTSKGLVVNTLEYLKNQKDNSFNKDYVKSTENIFVPNQKQKVFYHCLNYDFVNKIAKKALEISDEVFEVKKMSF